MSGIQLLFRSNFLIWHLGLALVITSNCFASRFVMPALTPHPQALTHSHRKFLSKNAIDSCARRSKNAARSKPGGSAATLPSGEGRSIVGVFMNA